MQSGNAGYHVKNCLSPRKYGFRTVDTKKQKFLLTNPCVSSKVIMLICCLFISLSMIYGTYRAMEEAYKDGKARAIGVSNFYPDRFIDLAEFCEIKPAVNQVETHVFNQQVKPQEIMKKYGTKVMSWGPFAEGRNNFFSNEVMKAIGERYGKSVAQVALRFLIQRDIIVIPKSTRKERMIENFDVFDFTLSAKDMEEIAGLDKRESLFFSHYDPEMVNFLINL